jgi:hypothetical protein
MEPPLGYCCGLAWRVIGKTTSLLEPTVKIRSMDVAHPGVNAMEVTAASWRRSISLNLSAKGADSSDEPTSLLPFCPSRDTRTTLARCVQRARMGQHTPGCLGAITPREGQAGRAMEDLEA